ncbi:MAG TPA: tetratricopeptide repeat protein [Polyangiaceae bacterium]|nr:tetratricopeptide repeat protein [Polyangiaceae bacterium]
MDDVCIARVAIPTPSSVARRARRRRLIFGVAIAAALAPARASRAQGAERDPAAAELLFEQGRAEARAGRYDRACPSFGESYRLDPAVGSLLNMADCAEHLARPAEALRRFTQALGELSASDARRSYVEGRIARLKPRVPRVRIVFAPGDVPANVLCDGVPVDRGALGAPLLVDPGRHVIGVRAPGRADRDIAVDAIENAEQQVRAEPGEARVAEPPAPPMPLPPARRAEVTPATGVVLSRARSNALPWVAGGIGALGIAVGSIAGIVAMSDAHTVSSRCPDRQCLTPAAFDAAGQAASEGKVMETVSTVAFGVGLAGAAAAAYLWLAAPSSAPTRSAAWVAPWGGSKGGGLAAGGRFE